MSHQRELGMKVLRMLTSEEQTLIQSVYESTKHTLLREAEITWTTLYPDSHLVDFPQQKNLHEWVTSVISPLFQHIPSGTPLHTSYGFLLNPSNSTKNQRWHEDYTSTAVTLMVPLTKVTQKNTTQYLNEYVKREYREKLLDTPDFLQVEGLESIVISQIICREYSLLQLLPGTVHRGIANGESWDRIVFWITVDEKPLPVEESQVKSSYYFKELKD